MWLSWVVQEVTVQLLSRDASEGLTETGESASRMTHSHGKLMLAFGRRP